MKRKLTTTIYLVVVFSLFVVARGGFARAQSTRTTD